MNFLPIGKNKIIAELSKEDMKALDITYEEMDYANIETRRVIRTVIDNIRRYAGRDIDPSCNLLIEAVANADGGCVLCFTVTENRRAPVPVQPVLTKNNSSVIYEFEDLNALLDMLKAVGRSRLPKENLLYRKQGRYRLVMRRIPAPNMRRAIEEYGKCVGQDGLLTAQTEEHWESAGSL